MIGKSKKPACIRGRKWPLAYINQKRAWIDQQACSRWYKEVFLPKISKKKIVGVLC